MPQSNSRDMRRWTIRDAADLYNINGWANGYFRIARNGHIEVTPHGPDGARVDLHELVRDLQRRGLGLPLLVRFSDVLHSRIRELVGCFERAIAEYEYGGRYRGVYPIKVNQQRHVVEELVHFGAPHGLGVEVGSKPELLAGLALCDTPDSLLVLNGYKDTEYLETALLSQKLGRRPIVVLDRFHELERLLAVASRLDVRPYIGLRAKLTSRGAGKWSESSGDRSKFGLTAAEMVSVLDTLREHDLLDRLQLLHFHIGSQISSVRAIKEAMKEGSRLFVELVKSGAGLRYLDVGGGLGVDYDGSSTNWHSSMNYTLQEYANDVVEGIQEACDAAGVAHPDLISESGRALVAHHSVLVFEVLDVDRPQAGTKPPSEAEVAEEPQVIQNLAETWRTLSRKNLQEAYHDVLELKEEVANLFNVGLLDLRARARAERIFWGCCREILRISRELDYVPEELGHLDRVMADTYYCNFSVFQSAPDHWAVKQLFPTLPIHRLDEQPTHRAVLADLTCDSDGKVDRFIDLRDVKHTLELHDPKGKPYWLGMFLVGAYQEILGDLHNLFGDTNAVHVSVDDSGYRVDHVVEGDTVTEVLGYVQYERRDLVARMRKATEHAVRRGLLSLEESARLMHRYVRGLEGYTYLGEEPEPERGRARTRGRRKRPSPSRDAGQRKPGRTRAAASAQEAPPAPAAGRRTHRT